MSFFFYFMSHNSDECGNIISNCSIMLGLSYINIFFLYQCMIFFIYSQMLRYIVRYNIVAACVHKELHSFFEQWNSTCQKTTTHSEGYLFFSARRITAAWQLVKCQRCAHTASACLSCCFIAVSMKESALSRSACRAAHGSALTFSLVND